MPTVTFATFCHPPHLERLHAPGVLAEIVSSHKYDFAEVLVVHQRCRGILYRPIVEVPHRVLESEDYYPQIFDEFGIDLNNPVMRRDCHGEGSAHWGPWHTLNHLIALKEARSDYVVFSDCDCLIVNDPPVSWVQTAISLLEGNPSVFVVGPGEGGNMAESRLPNGVRLTRNMSQQLFIVNRQAFLRMEFDIPWNWERIAPGGPMQEFYWMLEGRIWRYLDRYALWRAILPDGAGRYWHHGNWRPNGWVQWKLERGEQP